jgi:predicted negative regulator of RcsB-dependent stress response
LAKTKLTRKEIREDRVREVLVEVYRTLRRNRRYLLGGLLAVALLFVVTYAWETFQESRSNEIQTRFSEALKIQSAPLVTDETPPNEHDHTGPKYEFATAEERTQKALEAFTEFSDEYSGTQLGDFARYYIAINQQRLGKSSEAEQTLRSLIDETGSEELKNLARNHLAYVLQMQGNTAGMVEVLEEILADPSETLPRDTVLMKLARGYEASGNPEAALENYQKLQAEYPGGQNAQSLQSRIDILRGELGITDEAPAEEENAAEETPEA